MSEWSCVTAEALNIGQFGRSRGFKSSENVNERLNFWRDWRMGISLGFVIFTAMARDSSASLIENKNSMSCLKEQKR